MLDITCDECGKKYQVDETKMKSTRAKTKCKACSNVMQVIRPLAAESAEPSESIENNQLSVTAPIPEPPPPQTEFVPQSVVESPGGPAKDKSAEYVNGLPAGLSGQKIRFGLFGKVFIVMLIVGLLPFAVFWGITFRDTNDRIRLEMENLMAQTAGGLRAEADAWINNNVSVLRTAAKLPEIVSMDSMKQEMILKVIQKEYPWMYLVFTMGSDGMNVARNDGRPLKDYSDRRYYKDILAGKKLSWQTLIGITSKNPDLVLAVPIKSGENLLGVMAAAMTVDEISPSIANWRKGPTEFALILLAGTVLLVLIIAWFFARAIVRPIMKLTDAAERMSLGELNVRIDIKSKDEVGLLAQAIGRMQT